MKQSVFTQPRSLADMAARANNVRFTPKSGHPNKLEIDLTQFVFIHSAPLTNRITHRPPLLHKAPNSSGSLAILTAILCATWLTRC